MATQSFVNLLPGNLAIGALAVWGLVRLLAAGSKAEKMARAAERRLWSHFSPDPNLLIGIPPDRLCRRPVTAAYPVGRWSRRTKADGSPTPMELLRCCRS